MDEAIRYVGLDVHKETISVSVAAGDGREEARYYGQIVNNRDALRRLCKPAVAGWRSVAFLL